MKLKLRRQVGLLVFVIICFLGITPPGLAFFEQKPLTARSISLGASVIAGPSALDALALNPAALNQNKMPQVGLTQTNLFGLGMLANYFVLTLPFHDYGSFAMGYNQLKDLEVTYQEQVFHVGYGKALNPNLSLGAGLKLRQLISVEKATGYAADLGVLYQKGALSLGLHLEELAGRLNYSTGYKENRPLGVGVGLGYRLKPTTLLALALSNEDTEEARVGVEQQLSPNITFRAGYSRVLSIGLGVKKGAFSCDYALKNEELGMTHYFTLAYVL